jgi:hypothetical protein
MQILRFPAVPPDEVREFAEKYLGKPAGYFDVVGGQ